MKDPLTLAATSAALQRTDTQTQREQPPAPTEHLWEFTLSPQFQGLDHKPGLQWGSSRNSGSGCRRRSAAPHRAFLTSGQAGLALCFPGSEGTPAELSIHAPSHSTRVRDLGQLWRTQTARNWLPALWTPGSQSAHAQVRECGGSSSWALAPSKAPSNLLLAYQPQLPKADLLPGFTRWHVLPTQHPRL